MHKSFGGSLSSDGKGERPCGSWHVMQMILPSERGSSRLASFAFTPTLCSPWLMRSGWQARQVLSESGPYISETLPVELAKLWQLVQILCGLGRTCSAPGFGLRQEAALKSINTVVSAFASICYIPLIFIAWLGGLFKACFFQVSSN
jgi:hypothetical protein